MGVEMLVKLIDAIIDGMGFALGVIIIALFVEFIGWLGR